VTAGAGVWEFAGAELEGAVFTGAGGTAAVTGFAGAGDWDGLVLAGTGLPAEGFGGGDVLGGVAIGDLPGSVWAGGVGVVEGG